MRWGFFHVVGITFQKGPLHLAEVVKAVFGEALEASEVRGHLQTSLMKM